MRAIAVSEYGGKPTITELPKPEPGPGEVLIQTRAAAMNPVDQMIADGGLKEMMPARFPMVLGVDVAGTVEELGEDATRFSPGDEVFGQLMIAPLGSAGTYAEDVAVAQNAPLAIVPDGMEADVAATLPTAGSTGLDVVESLAPLDAKTVLIVGAGGGVGSFATQFAANAGAHVIADADADSFDRMRAYGVAATVSRTGPVLDEVRAAHPEGIDVLIDLASGPDEFSSLASLVRPGGTALTTRSVADTEALSAAGVTGVNYQLQASPDLLRRVAEAVVEERIAPPPITEIHLDDAPAALAFDGHVDGKTVIRMEA